MNATIVRRIAAIAGGAAVVAAVVVGCGATVHTAEPGPTAPELTTAPEAPTTVGDDDGGDGGQDFSGPVKLEEPTESESSSETAVQIAPGDDGDAGPSEVIRSGESAAPPTVETPAPPTGGGKGGH